ncbi:hypothetical protein R1flu_024225 [Riccia fluitans]|uniref:Uncharacterized protein n=1 Tax=Riccia fluitans TaxID=41844 RepID=A0ABD1XU94_9MARC
MDAKEKEDSKKRKALIHTVSDSNTEMDTKDEKEPMKEAPCVFCEGKASGSKPLDQKLDFAEWGNRVESLGRETSRLFEAFHVEIGSVTAEAVAQNMKKIFTPPPIVETDPVEDRLHGEEDRLAVMLGHKTPIEGSLMDDSHVTKMLELARMMIGQRE